MVFDRIDNGLKPWHVVAFVVVALALGALLGLSTGPHLRDLASVDIFELRFNGYHYEDAVVILQGLGEEGRSYYATSHLIPDIFFALFLFLAVSSLFLWLSRPGHRFAVPLNETVRLIIVSLAFVAFGADILEDIALWIVLGSGVEPATGVVAAASTFTGVKWLALAGSFAGLLATVIIAVIRGVSTQDAVRA